jgi:hypothetical protein
MTRLVLQSQEILSKFRHRQMVLFSSGLKAQSESILHMDHGTWPAHTRFRHGVRRHAGLPLTEMAAGNLMKRNVTSCPLDWLPRKPPYGDTSIARGVQSYRQIWVRRVHAQFAQHPIGNGTPAVGETLHAGLMTLELRVCSRVFWGDALGGSRRVAKYAGKGHRSLAGDSGAGRRRRLRLSIQWKGSTRRGARGWDANASRVESNLVQD